MAIHVLYCLGSFWSVWHLVHSTPDTVSVPTTTYISYQVFAIPVNDQLIIVIVHGLRTSFNAAHYTR